jgi:hypothetical protein
MCCTYTASFYLITAYYFWWVHSTTVGTFSWVLYFSTCITYLLYLTRFLHLRAWRCMTFCGSPPVSVVH